MGAGWPVEEMAKAGAGGLPEEDDEDQEVVRRWRRWWDEGLWGGGSVGGVRWQWRRRRHGTSPLLLDLRFGSAQVPQVRSPGTATARHALGSTWAAQSGSCDSRNESRPSSRQAESGTNVFAVLSHACPCWASAPPRFRRACHTAAIGRGSLGWYRRRPEAPWEASARMQSYLLKSYKTDCALL